MDNDPLDLFCTRTTRPVNGNDHLRTRPEFKSGVSFLRVQWVKPEKITHPTFSLRSATFLMGKTPIVVLQCKTLVGFLSEASKRCKILATGFTLSCRCFSVCQKVVQSLVAVSSPSPKWDVLSWKNDAIEERLRARPRSVAAVEDTT